MAYRAKIEQVQRACDHGGVDSMDLEEHTIEEMKERCERCGAPLTNGEIELVMESGESVFLCTTCSGEELPSSDEEAFES